MKGCKIIADLPDFNNDITFADVPDTESYHCSHTLFKSRSNTTAITVPMLATVAYVIPSGTGAAFFRVSLRANGIYLKQKQQSRQ